MRIRVFGSAVLILVLLIATTPAAAQSSSTFTYQGYLTNAGGPVTATCDFQFSLFNAVTAGSQIGSTLTRTGVSVAQGVFSVQLDFGLGVFNSVPRYLAIGAKCGAEVSYTALTPRQALTVAAYALTAFNTPFAWSLNGNTATNPATQFIGTTDNQAFEVRVNNLRALRIEPKTDATFGTVPNIIGGGQANEVTGGVFGATIAGGGGTSFSNYRNLVTGNFSTISGGRGNTTNGDDSTISGGRGHTANNGGTVGGGRVNTASGAVSTIGGGQTNVASKDFATVGGGLSNTASDDYSTVGGGNSNTASALYSTIGGGFNNTASALYSTVGGGSSNIANNFHTTVSGGSGNVASNFHSTVGGGLNNIANGFTSTVVGGSSNAASAQYSTVGGGRDNTASGSYSFAAGRQAKSDDNGAFVWGDSQFVDLFSPGVDTFTVRAQGGIWLGTGAAPAVMTAGRFIDTSTGGYLTTGGAWTNSSDRALKTNFTQIDPATILDAVAAMPISAWNYTAEGESVKHVGPTAQDFRAAFGLGQDDKSISTVDAAGVALAAIQGLKRENDAKQAEIDALRADVALLKLSAGEGLVLPAVIIAIGMIFLGAALIVTRRR